MHHGTCCTFSALSSTEIYWGQVWQSDTVRAQIVSDARQASDTVRPISVGVRQCQTCDDHAVTAVITIALATVLFTTVSTYCFSNVAGPHPACVRTHIQVSAMISVL